MTTLSVWQMSAAHCSANCVSCGVALRDAKNATNSLSSKSLFPDKSIKKRRRCIYLSNIEALAALHTNKQHKRPRRMIYRIHRANRWWGYTPNADILLPTFVWLKPPSFDVEESSKKYPIKYVQLNGTSHKPLQRYRKFLRKREFVKNSYVGICYLCDISPDLGCNRSGL